MKKQITSLLLVLCLLLPMLPVEVRAADSGTCGTNVTWTLDDEHVLTISGTGEMNDYYPSYSNKPAPWPYKNSISVVIIDRDVTSIGNYAFNGCPILTRVTIPNSVASIGNHVFDGCISLNSVEIPDSVTSIGSAAFYQCSSLTSVNIPDAVTNIGSFTFYQCSGLTSVTIPAGVTIIEENTFCECSNLTSVTIPAGVTEIRSNAFQECNSLTSVDIPNSVTYIGDLAFYGCSSLTSVEIPNSVTIIVSSAFSGCSGLTSVNIPVGVTSIGGSTFFKCSSLTSVTIPAGVTSIENSTFRECSSLNSVAIPRSVTSIGDRAFLECSSLTDVYYGGSQQDWDRISIGTDNDELRNATIHYNYASFTVTFDPQKGSVTPDKAATNGDGRLSELPIPTIDNECLEFGGWYKLNESDIITTETEFDRDTTVFARWDEKHTPETLPRVEPTCTNSGLTEGSRCSVCGTILTKQETIPAKGHTSETFPRVEPTCTADGLSGGTKCSDCGITLTGQTPISKLGHDWSAETRAETTAPTCTEKGVAAFTKICQRAGCDEKETREEEIDALDHDWGNETSKTTKDPTCTEAGSKTYTKTCQRNGCGETETRTEEIPATGHTLADLSGKAATCTEKGLTDGLKCSVCDTVTKEQKDIPALGHDWVMSGSGTETIIKEPTCTEEGSKNITGAECARCHTIGDNIIVTIPPVGHKWGEVTSEITKPATCTEDGVRTYTKRCTAEGCDEVKTKIEEISATGHTYGEWATTKEPTTTETGTKERVCASCGDKQTATIPAAGGGSSEPDTSKVFKITFDPNGGSGGTTLTTGTDGKLSALPSNPTRSGYTFDNWYTAKTGGERVTTSMVFEKDTTVYARWTEISSGSTTTKYRLYTPSYTSGGSVYVSHSSAAEGTRITIELSPRSTYEIDWLSVVNLNTGRELSLTRRYDDEYTFIMPDSPVEVEASFFRWNTGSGGWYVPEKPPISNKPVKWYYKDGQIWHVTDGLVSYSTLLTRDMLISVLYNMDPSSTGEQVFWATEYNIVPDIYASGLWGVDKNITREQIAMILYCYSKHMGYNLSPSTILTGYSDYGQVRSIARPAMSWAQATGLITSTSANRLAPRSNLNCGEANSILSHFVSTMT